MKVKDAGHVMSNAEVAHWISQKRAQHAREDAQDKASGARPTPRPPNFLKSLEKHERHLSSDAYPYEQNPSAYKGDNSDKSIAKFQAEHMSRIQEPLAAKYKDAVRKKELSVREAQVKLEMEQEKKELTEAELLMIHNHAPTSAEQLQPMIESVDDRFTPQELEVLLDIILKVFRVDQLQAARLAKRTEPTAEVSVEGGAESIG
ncbi:hypothetical protein BDY17DRAFT_303286 [Neohortaea acidophila]|uniref:DNA-directed RNA polymerase III subunit RPC9 n=1 Tax=Neohortaea acidophila TaxID=245834 RepID=A0A6A6PKE3_9PEZI|nr:uncharacterized protein BDY17DRAFT_303286 [Neohortaea acidophila]KAF2480134.1 hypothetical protein BDY17DRAFT_303286 [Neohortaea acidophila]